MLTEYTELHMSINDSHLRKFHPSISEVNVNNCSMIFDYDQDFGRMLSIDSDSCDTEVDTVDDVSLLSHENQCRSTHMAKDQPLPSNRKADQVSHLNSTQRH